MTNSKNGKASALSLLVAIILAGAGLFAACSPPGPLTKAEYEEVIVSAYDGIRSAFAATRVEEPEPLAARVADAQAALRDAADTLSTLQPPAEAQGANREIAEAWREYAQDLDELRAAILRGDTAYQQKFNEGVASHPAMLRVEEAVEELKSRGYQLGMLGKD